MIPNMSGLGIIPSMSGTVSIFCNSIQFNSTFFIEYRTKNYLVYMKRSVSYATKEKNSLSSFGREIKAKGKRKYKDV